jgi:hypothetical protein
LMVKIWAIIDSIHRNNTFWPLGCSIFSHDTDDDGGKDDKSDIWTHLPGWYRVEF